MYPPSAGLDHLGLGSVSADQILPTLASEINVLTVHPRYHSFYTFLLDEYWRRQRPSSRAAWVQFFRAREFIFSLGAHLCTRHGRMGGIVGADNTAALAAEMRQTYPTTYNYIKSDLGGYGLYYRTVIARLGLVIPGGRGLPHPIDVPTERGKELAEAFRQAVRDTAYYRRYFDEDDTEIPIDVITEYIDRACLCRLQEPAAPDRAILRDIFLHGGRDPDARRATFRLFLDLATQTAEQPIGEDAFRQLVYFGETADGARFRPQEMNLHTFKRWRLYQAREYYAFAINALWYYLCEWGLAHGGDVRPIAPATLWQHVDEALDFDGLAARLGVNPPGLRPDSDVRKLFDWLLTLVNATEETFDERCTIYAPVHEHRLYQLANTPAHRAMRDVMVAGMITQLALIYLRFGRPVLWGQAEWDISRMGSDGRLSLDAFVSELRRRLGRGRLAVRDLGRWLYDDYVILQHQVVATRKLPDNTFRFQREGDRLRFYVHDNRLDFMSSRFDAISTTLHDLGFCGPFASPANTLTADGEGLLREGDLE